MEHLVREQLGETVGILRKVMEDEGLIATLSAAAARTARALLGGRKLMVAGNGGSAADAQHLAAEFVNRLAVNRPALRAIALTTDSSILTSVGNDCGYERVFERQIEALGEAGDVFLGISTSGNSPNILRALALCREREIVTIGLSGGTGGRMPPLSDYNIVVPSPVTQHVQECHLALEHIFCMLVERSTFGPELFEPRPVEAEA